MWQGLGSFVRGGSSHLTTQAAALQQYVEWSMAACIWITRGP